MASIHFAPARLSANNNSVFDPVNQAGVDGSFSSAEYGAENMTLRLTAVPEPATRSLAHLSAPLLAGALSRRKCDTSWITPKRF